MQSGPELSAGMGAEHSSMSGDDKIMKLVGDGLAVRRQKAKVQVLQEEEEEVLPIA